MRRLLTFSLIIGVYCALLCIAVYYQVYQHELVHKKIYETFGCQNISIDVKCDILGCKGETVASCNFSENESELYYLMESLHIMNEIVSYNISEFWTLISVSTIFLLTLMYMVALKE